jgi:hypothetical protein
MSMSMLGDVCLCECVCVSDKLFKLTFT